MTDLAPLIALLASLDAADYLREILRGLIGLAFVQNDKGQTVVTVQPCERTIVAGQDLIVF